MERKRGGEDKSNHIGHWASSIMNIACPLADIDMDHLSWDSHSSWLDSLAAAKVGFLSQCPLNYAEGGTHCTERGAWAFKYPLMPEQRAVVSKQLSISECPLFVSDTLCLVWWGCRGRDIRPGAPGLHHHLLTSSAHPTLDNGHSQDFSPASSSRWLVMFYR